MGTVGRAKSCSTPSCGDLVEIFKKSKTWEASKVYTLADLASICGCAYERAQTVNHSLLTNLDVAKLNAFGLALYQRRPDRGLWLIKWRKNPDDFDVDAPLMLGRHYDR